MKFREPFTYNLTDFFFKGGYQPNPLETLFSLANFDPFVPFLVRIWSISSKIHAKTKKTLPSWLKTPPSTEERIDLAQAQPLPGPCLALALWHRSQPRPGAGHPRAAGQAWGRRRITEASKNKKTAGLQTHKGVRRFPLACAPEARRLVKARGMLSATEEVTPMWDP